MSDFLYDRLPYLADPFTSEIDPTQVTLAVFERKIPKLADCLTYENLPDDKRRDALLTLNEMTANQEIKDEQTAFEVLTACGALL